jgi:hypothetical protein
VHVEEWSIRLRPGLELEVVEGERTRRSWDVAFSCGSYWSGGCTSCRALVDRAILRLGQASAPFSPGLYLRRKSGWSRPETAPAETDSLRRMDLVIKYFGNESLEDLCFHEFETHHRFPY